MTDAPSMAGKYVLVTGGTGGIGKATAAGPAALGARVGITGRDQGRAGAAAADIRAATGSRARGHLCRRHVRPDGGAPSGCPGTWHLPAAGRASQQRRRVLGPPARHRRRPRAHLRAQPPRALPADQLAAGPAHRQVAPRTELVTVSSGAHTQGRLDFNDLQGERNYSGQRAYSQSKLANVMFTYHTGKPPPGRHRRHRHRSAPRRGSHQLRRRRPCRAPGHHDPRGAAPHEDPVQGPLTPIYLASSPDVEGVTGQYFADRKRKASSKASYDTVPRPGRGRPAPP